MTDAWKRFLASGDVELPNPDITLEKERANIAIYKRLLYDSRVWACMKKLVFYLSNLSFRIATFESNSDAGEQAKFFESLFERINFREQYDWGAVLTKFFGYTVSELLFEPTGNVMSIRGINVLPPEWFGFDLLGNLIYYPSNNLSVFELVKVLNAPPAELLDKSEVYRQKYSDYQRQLEQDVIYEHRLLLTRNSPSFQNPYGESDAARLFYEVLYRNMAKKFRAFNAEKFGVPTLLIETSFETTSDEGRIKAKRLTDFIVEYMGKGVVVKPVGTNVTPLIGVPSESRSLFDVQIADADQIIQDIILMQSGAQDLQSVGARAAVEVFEESASKAVWACKRTIEDAANAIMRTIAKINGWQLGCYYELYNAKEFDPYDELELDKALMDVSGLRFRKEYFIDKYSRNVNDFVSQSMSENSVSGDSVSGSDGVRSGSNESKPEAEAKANENQPNPNSNPTNDE